MCGIIGYVGSKNSVPFLIEGLKKLEYRGYDSAGIAVAEKGHIHRVRAVGKVAELEKAALQEAAKPEEAPAPAAPQEEQK